ncbi:Hypothetical predicted protein [Octopus vulgaris]|uniref:Uncharacterized protein n=2 Tax=Octopus TaxID=6643 RepID=A0AA36B7H5_OCTVU|nr:regulator of G-protein signaling 9-binding protein-like [Octopus sinensis]CAI9729285.1 Hypothetical predicted protein [Octopus vulgaris]
MTCEPKKRSLHFRDSAKIRPCEDNGSEVSLEDTRKQEVEEREQQCSKLIDELNKETACYSALAIGLGGSHDSPNLRNELTRIRTKSFHLVKQTMEILTLLYQRTEYSSSKRKNLENLFHVLCSSIEIFIPHLTKTIFLLSEFPLNNSSCDIVLINTGITDPLVMKKNSSSVIQDISTDVEVSPQQELVLLKRQIKDFQLIVYEISQKIHVNPWEEKTQDISCSKNKMSETTNNMNCINNNPQVSGLSSSKPAGLEESSNRRLQCFPTRRRWLLIGIIIILALSALVLGICSSDKSC